tara:strand:+ start:277 stop:456 length:180 start_codon:yes stop_codon:yes gene_type:complete
MKSVEEAKEVKTQLSELESQSLSILIKAVNLANKSGSYQLDEAVVIGNAKNVLEKLIEQ